MESNSVVWFAIRQALSSSSSSDSSSASSPSSSADVDVSSNTDAMSRLLQNESISRLLHNQPGLFYEMMAAYLGGLFPKEESAESTTTLSSDSNYSFQMSAMMANLERITRINCLKLSSSFVTWPLCEQLLRHSTTDESTAQMIRDTALTIGVISMYVRVQLLGDSTRHYRRMIPLLSKVLFESEKSSSSSSSSSSSNSDASNDTVIALIRDILRILRIVRPSSYQSRSSSFSASQMKLEKEGDSEEKEEEKDENPNSLPNHELLLHSLLRHDLTVRAMKTVLQASLDFALSEAQSQHSRSSFLSTLRDICSAVLLSSDEHYDGDDDRPSSKDQKSLISSLIQRRKQHRSGDNGDLTSPLCHFVSGCGAISIERLSSLLSSSDSAISDPASSSSPSSSSSSASSSSSSDGGSTPPSSSTADPSLRPSQERKKSDDECINGVSLSSATAEESSRRIQCNRLSQKEDILSDMWSELTTLCMAASMDEWSADLAIALNDPHFADASAESDTSKPLSSVSLSTRLIRFFETIAGLLKSTGSEGQKYLAISQCLVSMLKIDNLTDRSVVDSVDQSADDDSPLTTDAETTGDSTSKDGDPKATSVSKEDQMLSESLWSFDLSNVSDSEEEKKSSSDRSTMLRIPSDVEIVLSSLGSDIDSASSSSSSLKKIEDEQKEQPSMQRVWDGVSLSKHIISKVWTPLFAAESQSTSGGAGSKRPKVKKKDKSGGREDSSSKSSSESRTSQRVTPALDWNQVYLSLDQPHLNHIDLRQWMRLSDVYDDLSPESQLSSAEQGKTEDESDNEPGSLDVTSVKESGKITAEQEKAESDPSKEVTLSRVWPPILTSVVFSNVPWMNSFSHLMLLGSSRGLSSIVGSWLLRCCMPVSMVMTAQKNMSEKLGQMDPLKMTEKEFASWFGCDVNSIVLPNVILRYSLSDRLSMVLEMIRGMPSMVRLTGESGSSLARDSNKNGILDEPTSIDRTASMPPSSSMNGSNYNRELEMVFERFGLPSNEMSLMLRLLVENAVVFGSARNSTMFAQCTELLRQHVFVSESLRMETNRIMGSRMDPSAATDESQDVAGLAVGTAVSECSDLLFSGDLKKKASDLLVVSGMLTNENLTAESNTDLLVMASLVESWTTICDGTLCSEMADYEPENGDSKSVVSDEDDDGGGVGKGEDNEDDQNEDDDQTDEEEERKSKEESNNNNNGSNPAGWSAASFVISEVMARYIRKRVSNDALKMRSMVALMSAAASNTVPFEVLNLVGNRLFMSSSIISDRSQFGSLSLNPSPAAQRRLTAQLALSMATDNRSDVGNVLPLLLAFEAICMRNFVCSEDFVEEYGSSTLDEVSHWLTQTVMKKMELYYTVLFVVLSAVVSQSRECGRSVWFVQSVADSFHLLMGDRDSFSASPLKKAAKYASPSPPTGSGSGTSSSSSSAIKSTSSSTSVSASSTTVDSTTPPTSASPVPSSSEEKNSATSSSAHARHSVQAVYLLCLQFEPELSRARRRGMSVDILREADEIGDDLHQGEISVNKFREMIRKFRQASRKASSERESQRSALILERIMDNLVSDFICGHSWSTAFRYLTVLIAGKHCTPLMMAVILLFTYKRAKGAHAKAFELQSLLESLQNCVSELCLWPRFCRSFLALPAVNRHTHPCVFHIRRILNSEKLPNGEDPSNPAEVFDVIGIHERFLRYQNARQSRSMKARKMHAARSKRSLLLSFDYLSRGFGWDDQSKLAMLGFMRALDPSLFDSTGIGSLNDEDQRILSDILSSIRRFQPSLQEVAKVAGGALNNHRRALVSAGSNQSSNSTNLSGSGQSSSAMDEGSGLRPGSNSAISSSSSLMKSQQSKSDSSSKNSINNKSPRLTPKDKPPPITEEDRLKKYCDHVGTTQSWQYYTNEIKKILRTETMVEYFSVYLVDICVLKSLDCQKNYRSMLEAMQRKDVYESVCELSYKSVEKLLNTENILSDSFLITKLKGLGSWIGKITLGMNKPLLQRRINLKDMLINGFIDDTLVVILPFIKYLLDSAVNHPLFGPPSPWLMSILNLLSEMHGLKPKMQSHYLYEIEDIFGKFNLSINDAQPSSLITNEMKMSHPLSAAYTRVNQLDPPMGVPNMHEFLKVPSGCLPMLKIPHFKHMLAYAIDLSIQTMLNTTIRRIIQISFVYTCEIGLKDTLFERDGKQIERDATAMIRAMVGALTVVNVRDGLRGHLNSKLKNILEDVGYEPLNEALDSRLLGSIAKIVDSNMGVACSCAEKLACQNATMTLTKELGSVFQRKIVSKRKSSENLEDIHSRLQRRVYHNFLELHDEIRDAESVADVGPIPNIGVGTTPVGPATAASAAVSNASVSGVTGAADASGSSSLAPIMRGKMSHSRKTSSQSSTALAPSSAGAMGAVVSGQGGSSSSAADGTSLHRHPSVPPMTAASTSSAAASNGHANTTGGSGSSAAAMTGASSSSSSQLSDRQMFDELKRSLQALSVYTTRQPNHQTTRVREFRKTRDEASSQFISSVRSVADSLIRLRGTSAQHLTLAIKHVLSFWKYEETQKSTLLSESLHWALTLTRTNQEPMSKLFWRSMARACISAEILTVFYNHPPLLSNLVLFTLILVADLDVIFSHDRFASKHHKSYKGFASLVKVVCENNDKVHLSDFPRFLTKLRDYGYSIEEFFGREAASAVGASSTSAAAVAASATSPSASTVGGLGPKGAPSSGIASGMSSSVSTSAGPPPSGPTVPPSGMAAAASSSSASAGPVIPPSSVIRSDRGDIADRERVTMEMLKMWFSLYPKNNVRSIYELIKARFNAHLINTKVFGAIRSMYHTLLLRVHEHIEQSSVAAAAAAAAASSGSDGASHPAGGSSPSSSTSSSPVSAVPSAASSKPDWTGMCDQFAAMIVAFVNYHPSGLDILQLLFDYTLEQMRDHYLDPPTRFFDQRPFSRLIMAVMDELVWHGDECELSQRKVMVSELLSYHARFLEESRPQVIPEFSFGWFTLLTHRTFMGRILEKISDMRGYVNGLCNDADRDGGDSTALPIVPKSSSSAAAAAASSSSRSGMTTTKMTLSEESSWNGLLLCFRDRMLDAMSYLKPMTNLDHNCEDEWSVYYRGVLRVSIVISLDWSFVFCENHYLFSVVIPLDCLHLRNVVLSAFPWDMDLKSINPFHSRHALTALGDWNYDPLLSLDYQSEFDHSIHSSYYGTVLRDLIDYAVSVPNIDDDRELIEEMTAMLVISSTSESSTSSSDSSSSMIPKRSLLQATIIYLCDGCMQYSNPLLNRRRRMVARWIECLADEYPRSASVQVSYHLMSAICDNLRFPNSHTKFCFELCLFLWEHCVHIRELMTRLLMERLSVLKPHPWGLIVTFVELHTNPRYRFFEQPFVQHCSREVSQIIRKITGPASDD